MIHLFPGSFFRCDRRVRPGFVLGVLLALLPLRGVALDPAENPRDYIITRWDAEDGLAQSLVRQIIQTRDGYLWAGTVQGLSRFDGLTFTNFRANDTPGFPGNVITSLAETADGSLWIGTATGLGRYFRGRFTTYTLKDGLKSVTINTLCVAPDGSLWIGSGSGITRWVGGRFVQDIDTSMYNTLAMQAITADREGAIWIATGIEALRYAGGQFTRFRSEHGLPNAAIRAVRADTDGRPLAVTLTGLFRLENERFVPFQPRPANTQINTSLVDGDGNLWIGSAGGLERYANETMEPHVDAHGEAAGPVDTILEDREGCLWVGGPRGLARLVNRRGRTLSTEEGILGASGLAIRESRDGSVWISSWAGGVARLQNGNVRQYGVGAPLSHESVTCIYEAPDGTMWFGNRGSAVDRLDGDKVTTFVLPSGVPTSRYVSVMHAEPDGEFLVAIAGRGLLALRDGALVPVPEAAALATGIIWSIHRTRDGRLLLAGTQGLFERASDRSIHPVVLPGLAGVALAIRALAEEDDGGIWLATDGRGLIHWQAGRARVYGEREGMISNIVSSALDDRSGSIWVTSSRGIARIPRTEFAEFNSGKTARLNITTFGRVDGLQNASISTGGAPLAARLSDGRLMFASGQGVAVIDPRTLQLNERPPTVVVEDVIADDRSLVAGPEKTVVVPAGANRIEVRYTALSLIAPRLLRFRYQLQGSDPDWVEAGRERSARYTHLAPGDYTFRVLACNSDGVWNQTGATLGFTVQPFFYQTGWFAGLTALTGAFAIFGVYRARIRLTRQRMARLESLVGERTAELRQAKDAAEAAREEIARERSRFKFIFEALPVGVTWVVSGRVDTWLVNPEHARITGVATDLGQHPERDWEATHPEDRVAQGGLQAQLDAGRIDRYALEKRYVRPDGTVVWASLTVRSFHDPAAGGRQEIRTIVDITARREAEDTVKKVHQQLLETSRQAGMAEVATNVLHNVGNVLNSVNVSATLVADRVRQSKAGNVGKLAALLEENKAGLPRFLAEDSRGRLIPDYLTSLAEALADEQKATIDELAHLRKNVEHIKDIVAMQQSNARSAGVIARVSLTEMVEDALRINASSLVRHDVALERDFQFRGEIATDKHKVMQILINLVRNAKEACDESGRPDKRIAVRTAGDGRWVRILVSDNGVGIPPENLTRVFNHGFTTRKHGHGFGLHSGALAAKELGGSLAVESAGPGAGATFVLELPVPPEPTSP